MKLGLIVEGYADGAVCRIAAQRLVPGLTVHEPTVMVNRPRLLDGCGDAAAALLKAGKCDKVAVVWDLYPNWADKQFKPCRKADRERALASLAAAGLEAGPRVVLVCIQRELETWLIADVAAIKSVLVPRYIAADRLQKINPPGKPERHADPKGWLEDTFDRAKGTKYTDREHAPAIMGEISDLKALRKVPSFSRFAAKLLGVPSWPPAK
ncbi:MAG: DUF4276 family protein [Phycisphaerales bacterium]|jgi:hypothetical protein|nr:DUF4276 family protein [Phycisphaeraceae bacterium]